MGRNGYKLKGSLKRRGYDWWWHSFTGRHRETGEEKAFFVEYYIINPGLMEKEPIFGQLPENRTKGIKPSYGMIKAGIWGEGAGQIHNFWGKDKVQADFTKMNVNIGGYTADENHMKGKVSLSEEEVKHHPEYMSQAGFMSWDLKLYKTLKFSVGYGASKLFQFLNAFKMYWHVEGMKVEMEGKVTYNGEEYIVSRDNSYGYQDKNWGTDYTNPWIWLNCNNFHEKGKNEYLPLTSLDVGGGRPVVFGVPIPRKMLIAFYHDNRLYEFNFSKFWRYNKQWFDCPSGDTYVYWNVTAETRKNKIEVNFKSRKSEMLSVNYENPDGEKLHNNLWNGGTAFGTVKLYGKQNGKWVLLHEFEGSNGGCEYGDY